LCQSPNVFQENLFFKSHEPDPVDERRFNACRIFARGINLEKRKMDSLGQQLDDLYRAVQNKLEQIERRRKDRRLLRDAKNGLGKVIGFGKRRFVTSVLRKIVPKIAEALDKERPVDNDKGIQILFQQIKNLRPKEQRLISEFKKSQTRLVSFKQKQERLNCPK